MAKRAAGRELTQENWAEEDDQEEMGTFQVASADQLASRTIRKAKRRGTNGDSSAPSIFKGLSVFSGFGGSSEVSSQPTFNFLSSATKNNSDGNIGSFSSSVKSDKITEKTTQPLRITQDSFSSSAKGSGSKSNGTVESKDIVDSAKKDSLFLSNLKALNEGVLLWIQKHLDKNPHVNLSPVFEDYKKHYSELLKKYPSELENGRDDEAASLTNNIKKDVTSGKENTPIIPEVSKEKPVVNNFSFGVQSSSADKSSEVSKPLFTFGSSSSSDKEKKTDTPAFSFTAFNSSNKKTEGLVFGNSNSTGSSGLLFGGMASQAAKPAGVGFSFSSTSTTAAVTDKKEDTEKAEDPSDEPPKVEVNEIKEEGAFYEKKCKLFYMKDGAYVDRGVGTLYLKKAGEKTQLLIRAYTNLGNILLNIVLNSSVPCARLGKNGVLIVCIPNPPLEKTEGPVKMLIRVKTSEDADVLLEKLNEYKK